MGNTNLAFRAWQNGSGLVVLRDLAALFGLAWLLLQPEKALLALRSQWPLTVLLGYEAEVKQESKGWFIHCHWHSSEVGIGTYDSTDGCWYQACSRLSKSQIKRIPVLSPPLSLSHPPLLSFLCLFVSHWSNPVTLLQAPPPSYFRLYIFLAPSLPLLCNSAQCWITKI